MGRDEEIQQDNSGLIQCNKPAVHLKFNFAKFKEGLLSMATPSQKELKERRAILAQECRDEVISKIFDLQNSMKKLMAGDSLGIHLSMNDSLNEASERLRRLSLKNCIKAKPKERGRPPINGRIAIVLLSALQATKGNRILKDKIGKYIQFNGEFHKLVNKRFGEGAFEKLNLPSVRINDDRWDSSIIKQLELAGLRFLMETPSAKASEQSYKISLMRQFESMKSRAHYLALTDDELNEFERRHDDNS